MDRPTIVSVKGVRKTFKVYQDKGSSIKERALFWKRNRYETRLVLDGINIDIHQGETLGLIGRNGSGKSTLLKLLTGIYYPNGGTIVSTGRISALIELGAGFHPDMSGRENIYINASIFGLKKKEIDQRLDDIISFSELGHFIDNPVRTYSSGMYMRLAFSVAINVDADILLIDEILAVGDQDFQSKCYRKLDELKEKGVTIVIVSHDANAIASFCERVIWLSDGRIAYDGPTLKGLECYSSNSVAGKELDGTIAERKPQMDTTMNHFGNFQAEIRSAYFMVDGKRTNVINQGSKAELLINYVRHSYQGPIIYGIGFFSLDGTNVYGTNTRIDGVTIDNLDEEGTVSLLIPSMDLVKGEYKLNVSLIQPDDTPLDYYRDYLHFLVHSKSSEVGVAAIPHTWKRD